jgi:hypothetical protein
VSERALALLLAQRERAEARATAALGRACLEAVRTAAIAEARDRAVPRPASLGTTTAAALAARAGEVAFCAAAAGLVRSAAGAASAGRRDAEAALARAHVGTDAVRAALGRVRAARRRALDIARERAAEDEAATLVSRAGQGGRERGPRSSGGAAPAAPRCRTASG